MCTDTIYGFGRLRIGVPLDFAIPAALDISHHRLDRFPTRDTQCAVRASAGVAYL